MGYRCTLKANKNIKEQDVEEVLNTLPPYLSGPLGNTKQSWGWSCGCDVYLPKRNQLDIGGSYSISGGIAEDFIKHIKRGLNNKGYTITTNWED